MKYFNVRVAIVEPGIIDTPMAQGIGTGIAAPQSRYPQPQQMAAYFIAALKNPTPPSLVAEKIKNIIECGEGQPEFWQLRHPVGPGAAPLLESRKATTDEAYVALHASDDETWYTVMEKNTGMALRPKA
jgi:NAD(P)-dependent dehydrogenase (short-subunit alcohol dehydrogenase family)